MARFLIGFVVVCLFGLVAFKFPSQAFMFIICIPMALCIFFISSLIGDAVVWAYSSLLRKLRK
ncbi:hypothetical protein HOT15_gp12 [Dickeya phage Dagda]|uniref:Uncharacterized protein n=2 Tax=Aarhusvirus dagda TaxID=2732762 RepID=A0A2S1GSI9_9CAUD|nr:hypothetical protein HOT15_gp12 [Dickeya phage Dagda]AWD92365.1 hypothetical protein [Dickeya phage Dagda]AXY81616.1 hypothetical protein [Dickeya phage Dagda_B1]